jgi:hypothetical protein
MFTMLKDVHKCILRLLTAALQITTQAQITWVCDHSSVAVHYMVTYDPVTQPPLRKDNEISSTKFDILNSYYAK